MKNLRLILYLFFQTCSLFGYAQNAHLTFEHINSASGLSHNNILCILQDSRGFMWFGTWQGLNKYDGYNITVYKNDPLDIKSISNNYINGIAESKNGNIWIATSGGGLCLFDRNNENFIRYRHNSNNPFSLASDVLQTVIEDKAGIVWIGTDKGLDRFDPAKNKFEHFVPDPEDEKSISDFAIRYIFEDADQQIWIGTINGGLNLYNPAHKNFTRYMHNVKDSKTISSNDIYHIFEDSKRRLLVGTNGGGLNLFDKKTGGFQHFKHDENDANSIPTNVVLAINEDADNNLWVSTENGGISIFNYTTGKITNYKNDDIDKESISNNSVYAICRDAKNNMWLGNFAGGVDMASRDKTQFLHYRHMMLNNSLSHNQVLTIMEDRNKNIWIGTDGGGLNLFNPATDNFTHYRHQKNNDQSICGDYVLNTLEDSKGNIWICTWGKGITVYNPIKGTYQHFKNDPANANSLASNYTWKVFEDKAKNIWIGTFGKGLDLYDPVKNKFIHHVREPDNSNSISSDNIVNLFEDSEGLLWIGTEGGGLNVFNKNTGTFSHFTHDDANNSISNNSINSIYEDENKDLWIGTMTGLNKFDKTTGQFKVYTTADGLPGDFIYGIMQDSKKSLWMSTNSGIACLNPATGQFKNYGVADGVQSDEFKQLAYCKSSSGEMYFGGINGFNRFTPERIIPSPYEPPLIITNFQIFNKKVPIAVNNNDQSPLVKSITETKSITLPYSSAVFSFEFATLNYTNANKKRYSYKLEGFDKGWNEAGAARIATYTNLDPGFYTFKVKGLNNEGNWSTKTISIELIILPPYWLTWWFRILMFILVAGGVIGFYLFRVNDISAQRLKLQKQVEDQTQRLVLLAREEHNARKEAEDANIKMEYANKDLKLKNEELEQFAYVASHDLQEPLRTSAGFITLLQQQYKGRLDERADKYLNYVVDASERMKVLIKDLLDFSRIGTNVQLKNVDCNKVVINMLQDILAATDEANAEIKIAKLPEVYGYPTEIKLLFQNLVINSIKFRRKGVSPQIIIDVKKKGQFWEFSVTDNGIGIEWQHNERIFEIFQRLHTRSEYKGSGIGLSHCKKIVELHHGKIWLESVPGTGTTFYFTLPEAKKETVTGNLTEVQSDEKATV